MGAGRSVGIHPAGASTGGHHRRTGRVRDHGVAGGHHRIAVGTPGRGTRPSHRVAADTQLPDEHCRRICVWRCGLPRTVQRRSGLPVGRSILETGLHRQPGRTAHKGCRLRGRRGKSAAHMEIYAGRLRQVGRFVNVGIFWLCVTIGGAIGWGAHGPDRMAHHGVHRIPDESDRHVLGRRASQVDVSGHRIAPGSGECR